MKTLSSFALAVVFCLVAHAQSPMQTQAKKANERVFSPQQLFKRLSLSVFIVEAMDAQGSVIATGSGVAVSVSAVVTNKHVIEGGVAFRVKQGKRNWPATIFEIDPDHDLCQLRAEGLEALPVPVRTSSTLKVGERVYAIGAPQGLELTLSDGLISGLREYDHTRIIQTSAAISPGSSGGGLFDAQGRLVGITTFFVKEGQNLNFALPGDWIVALAWFERGLEADEAGDYQKAIRAYREAIRFKPDHAVAWLLLGYAYDSLAQYNQAAKAYQEVVRLKPDDARAYYYLGLASRMSGQHNQAVKAFQEAIRLKTWLDAWYELGIAYVLLKQYDMKAYQEAIPPKPDNAKAWFDLGRAYDALMHYDQAVEAYQEAIRLEPDFADAWHLLGGIYALQGNRSKAMQVYEKLKTLAPEKADEFFRFSIFHKP